MTACLLRCVALAVNEAHTDLLKKALIVMDTLAIPEGAKCIMDGITVAISFPSFVFEFLVTGDARCL